MFQESKQSVIWSHEPVNNTVSFIQGKRPSSTPAAKHTSQVFCANLLCNRAWPVASQWLIILIIKQHWLRWASWLIFSSSNYYSHFSPRFLASSQSKGVAAYSWATQRHGDERIPAIVIESFFHQQQNPSQCSNNIWLIIYNYKHFNFEYPHFTTHVQIETASWSNLFASTVQSFQACSMTSAWSPFKDPLSLLRNYEWETDSSNATQLIYTWHNLGQCNMTMTMTIIILQTQTMNQKMCSAVVTP